MTILRRLMIVALVVCAPGSARAGQPYFVAGGFGGSIYRLEDVNGDGDALDVGEQTVWASGLTSAFELARYGSGLLSVDASGGRLLRIVDANGDGDALDAGEVTTWATGFVALNGVSVDAQNAVYLADYSANRVYRAVDANHDGDALDVGEQLLFNDAISGPVSALARRNDVLVTGYTSGQVHRLVDANHDGDALDAGENLVHTPNTISQVAGLLPAPNGAYFVGSQDQNTIFHVRDANGDGDALDTGEVLRYADNLNGPINEPWGLAPRVGGGLLAANYNGTGVVAVRDANGDGDGLDVGEARLFADGVGGLSGIVAGIGPGPADRMITIQSATGTLDPAAPNFVAIVEGSTLKAGAVVARLNAGTGVLISTDAPATFANGSILQQAGAAIAKTAGGAATLTMRADDSIELAGGISSSAGSLAVVLVANDATLAYRDNDAAAGDVIISAPINTAGGSFTSSGVNFDNTGGDITAGNVTLVYTGTVTIGAALTATSLNLTAAGGLNVTPSGQLKGANAINGNFVNAGQLAPGASPGNLAISGDFTQLSTGQLMIELGGLTAGVSYDRLQVSGHAALAGTLDVDLINSFAPVLGDRFTVLTFASRSGNFGSYLDVNLGGHKTLKPLFDATSLTLRAAPARDGDLNLDGIVDISDVQSVAAHWLTASPLGDANLDNFVDISDVQVIAANWLQTDGGGSGATSVPEPSAIVLALVAVAGMGWPGVWRRRNPVTP